MHEIDVFILHGITKEVDASVYYSNFIEGIQSYLPTGASHNIRWHPIDYSHILSDKEETIFSWMKDLGHQRSRKFACDFICDILAMTHKDRPLEKGDFLYDLNEQLFKIYDSSAKIFPEGKRILIGHSLGTILGYRWTWQRHFDSLITMGSPFTYFSIAYKNLGQMNPNLPEFWNFWKKYDRVATIISKNPNFRMVKDIQVKTLNPLNWLTAKAHSDYWKDDAVHQQIAKIILSHEQS